MWVDGYYRGYLDKDGFHSEYILFDKEDADNEGRVEISRALRAVNFWNRVSALQQKPGNILFIYWIA